MQQRDLYRAMLDEADITIAAKESTGPGSGIKDPGSLLSSPQGSSLPMSK